MSTLNDTERNQWTKILNDASVSLTKLVMEHSTRKAQELKSTELAKRKESVLSELEQCELERYENKKQVMAEKRKSKKYERDQLPICGNGAAQAEASGVDGRVGPALICDSKDNLPCCNVVNVSSRQLSPAELKLLSKGLNFSPSSGNINEFELYQDLDNFARNLRLREYFHDQPTGSKKLFPGLSDKMFTPSEQRDKHLDMYISAVQKDIITTFEKRLPVRSNLGSDEREALKSLSEDSGIVIKPADKGGAVVILNKNDYLKEGQRQLTDKTFYRKLAADPTIQFEAEIIDALKSLLDDGKITHAMYKLMVPHNSKPGRFYLLPKIHKENNPGRPIVSSNGTATEKISSFIDHLIKDIPPTFPSYIKDTGHFLREVSNLVVPPGSFLVTMDVTSLYTNIPHTDGILAAISSYGDSNFCLDVSPSTLETLLRLVLEYNHFEFDSEHYLQINGTAMGTKMAPTYANIFMASLETEFIGKRCPKPVIYKRFLDDIFFIWDNDEASLTEFISDINSLHPSIKLTHQISTKTINFLDVTLLLDSGNISTTLYRKPTDRQQYLHFFSSHPRHCKTGIPYSQAHRYRRICSGQEDFEKNARELKTSLIGQKYPEGIVDDAIERARNLEREDILAESRKENHPETNLVLTYSSKIPKVNDILRRNFNIIKQSDRLSAIFQQPPRVVYRRGKNLRDLLVNAKTEPPERAQGCRPCGKPRCKVCTHIETTNIAQASRSTFKYAIKENLNCDTSNVIYKLRCLVCNQEYIGQTETPFRTRFNNHKSHVKGLPGLPLSRHLRLPDHSFERIQVVLIQSGFRNTYEREQRESFFIHKFRTLTEGINESAGRLGCLRDHT